MACGLSSLFVVAAELVVVELVDEDAVEVGVVALHQILVALELDFVVVVFGGGSRRCCCH